MQINHPFQIDGRSRTAQAGQNDHIRQMIEQLLFTSPGERVNRPTFGTGLQQLVFAPNSSELASATEFMIQGALQEHLDQLIQVQGVSVESEDATLRITVQYVVRRNQQRETAQFSREV
jgi:phage baseplate assembly protein W